VPPEIVSQVRGLANDLSALAVNLVVFSKLILVLGRLRTTISLPTICELGSHWS
jgi:hypothetical protein